MMFRVLMSLPGKIPVTLDAGYELLIELVGVGEVDVDELRPVTEQVDADDGSRD